MDRKELDLADDLIFGATNIAKEMGLNPRQTYHMLYNDSCHPHSVSAADGTLESQP